MFVGLLAVEVGNAADTQKAQPLKITDGPRVEGVGDNWAVIAWTTNAGGSSVVHYGTDRNNLSHTAQAPYADVEKAKQQTHRVRITSLKPNTTYYFVADSAQGEGTGTEAKSATAQFTTKGAGQAEKAGGQKAEALKVVDGPRVEGAGDTWAVIAWTTNTGGSSIVRYGTDRNNLSQMAEAPYADVENAKQQTHRVRINNLKPSTTYYFLVDSGQGEGTGTEAKSSIAQFKTK
jgi:hypothetical protein